MHWGDRIRRAWFVMSIGLCVAITIRCWYDIFFVERDEFTYTVSGPIYWIVGLFWSAMILQSLRTTRISLPPGGRPLLMIVTGLCLASFVGSAIALLFVGLFNVTP